MKLEANKYYKTRSGLKARVLCTDAPGGFPCVGYIYYPDESISREWSMNGKYLNSGEESTSDLISECIDEPKTRKVTLRRAIERNKVGEIFVSQYTNYDMSKSQFFIQWYDSIEVEVPVKE